MVQRVRTLLIRNPLQGCIGSLHSDLGRNSYYLTRSRSKEYVLASGHRSPGRYRLGTGRPSASCLKPVGLQGLPANRNECYDPSLTKGIVFVRREVNFILPL